MCKQTQEKEDALSKKEEIKSLFTVTMGKGVARKTTFVAPQLLCMVEIETSAVSNDQPELVEKIFLYFYLLG